MSAAILRCEEMNEVVDRMCIQCRKAVLAIVLSTLFAAELIKPRLLLPTA